MIDEALHFHDDSIDDVVRTLTSFQELGSAPINVTVSAVRPPSCYLSHVLTRNGHDPGRGVRILCFQSGQGAALTIGFSDSFLSSYAPGPPDIRHMARLGGVRDPQINACGDTNSLVPPEWLA